jgi:hypothetical protein
MAGFDRLMQFELAVEHELKMLEKLADEEDRQVQPGDTLKSCDAFIDSLDDAQGPLTGLGDCKDDRSHLLSW